MTRSLSVIAGAGLIFFLALLPLPTQAQTRCCSAASNNGGLFLFGYATADLSSGSGALFYQAWMAIDGVNTMSVLYFPMSQNLTDYPGSYSKAAQAGFIIHAADPSNGSGSQQQMVSWSTDATSSKVVCKNETIPVQVVPGFNACPGVEGSLFGASSSTYPYPNSAYPNPSPFLVYTVAASPTNLAAFSAFFLEKSDGVCEMTSFSSTSPINPSVFSFTPTYAAPAPAEDIRRANFYTPPTACNV